MQALTLLAELEARGRAADAAALRAARRVLGSTSAAAIVLVL